MGANCAKDTPQMKVYINYLKQKMEEMEAVFQIREGSQVKNPTKLAT